MIVQCSPFCKSLNHRNIDKSFSDNRIRFPFQSSFWISLSGGKLTILPDIQPANRIVVICSLRPFFPTIRVAHLFFMYLTITPLCHCLLLNLFVICLCLCLSNPIWGAIKKKKKQNIIMHGDGFSLAHIHHEKVPRCVL